MSSKKRTPRGSDQNRGPSDEVDGDGQRPTTPGREVRRNLIGDLDASPSQEQRRLRGEVTPPLGDDGGGSSDLLPLPPSSSPTQETSDPFSSDDQPVSSPLAYDTPDTSSDPVGGSSTGDPVTPRRQRADVRTDFTPREVDMSDPVMEESSTSDSRQTSSDQDAEDVPQTKLVIWGTDVNINHCKERFSRFLHRFIEQVVEEDELFDGMDIREPYYMQRLDEMNTIGEPYLSINCKHMKDFDKKLYRQLVNYPQEVIPAFDTAINEIFSGRFPDTTLDRLIEVRPYNVDKTSNMRSLDPNDIDKLITITGMVIRMSALIPEMREAFFKCHMCRYTTTVAVDHGRIAEPTLCTNCNTNHSFALIHNRSFFSDKQMIKLQESPEDMPAGQTPHTVIVYAFNELVDSVQPGDRVTITGIYRAMATRINPRLRNIRSVYKTHIDLIHFRTLDTSRLKQRETDGGDENPATLTPEAEEVVKCLARKADVYERLASALAPSIYEHDDIKKGILLQLFGGTRKDFSSTGRGNFRSELNLLLCGDPGTSKSQLLQYVYHLMPRGQYTSGKGSSAVGLTAYVTKDPETKQLVLQTGALVLSDNGVCCIDEFDKMNDTTRSVLHEVMEQQTLSIAKAGIICSLNARTSILAAANPVESQWNKNKTITENIQLPHTLLSRFDLIFLMLDPQDEHYDRRLASHLVSLYFHGAEEDEENASDKKVLRDYIAYAKANVHPALDEESGQALIQAYVEMRQVGSSRGQVSAYPRQLESLIRLSEAHARMRLSDTVEIADVEEARRLYREALKQSAVDPSTGKIDITILITGMGGAARKRKVEMAMALKSHLEAKGKIATIKHQKLFEEIREKSDFSITKDMFEDALRDLEDEDFLVVTSKTIRLCR